MKLNLNLRLRVPIIVALVQQLYMVAADEDCWLWQYRLCSFQAGDTKLERVLPKNQHTQRKLLNFENWTKPQ